MGLIVTLLVTLLGSAPALAAEPADPDVARAKELFENGTILYDEGNYEAAVAAFREAHELSDEPLMLYNMASALERLGRWEEAIAALDGYRAFAPADERDVLERRIRALESRVADRREEEAAAREAAQSEVQPEPARRGPSALGVTLLGTGAVGVGLGSVFTARALGARGDWKALCLDRPDGLLCPAEADPLVTRDRRSGLIADVAWGVGILGLGGGIAVSLGGSKSADLSVAVRPDGLAVGGRW